MARSHRRPRGALILKIFPEKVLDEGGNISRLTNQISRQASPLIQASRADATAKPQRNRRRRRENVQFPRWDNDPSRLCIHVYTYVYLCHFFFHRASVLRFSVIRHYFSLRCRRKNYLLLLRWLFQVERERVCVLFADEKRKRGNTVCWYFVNLADLTVSGWSCAGLRRPEAAEAVSASSYVDTIKRGSKEGRGWSGGARDWRHSIWRQPGPCRKQRGTTIRPNTLAYVTYWSSLYFDRDVRNDSAIRTVCLHASLLRDRATYLFSIGVGGGEGEFCNAKNDEIARYSFWSANNFEFSRVLFTV